MPTLETLTEADLNTVLNGSSKHKAREYLARIQFPERRGNSLTAQVTGTRLYQIEIEVDPSGIYARCTCPHNWGGYCKHIAAVLLHWIQNRSAFTIKEAAALTPDQPIEVISITPPATHRPAQKPTWLLVPFAAQQQLDGQQLSRWLEALKVQDLRQMAKKRGWSIRGTKKEELINQIVESMTRPESIGPAIASLDAEHRQVFWALAVLGNDPGTTYDDLERVASRWGRLTSFKQVSTYSGHLAEMGLAVSGEVLNTYPPRIDFIPRAVLRHLPPVPGEIIPASPGLRSDGPASELHFADPFPLVRAAGQLLLMLEQAPVALRTPQPRPRLERFYEALGEWAYDPHELQAAKQQGQLRNPTSLTLTVPPPPPALPDEAIERLVPIAGDEARLEFTFSLLVAAGLFQPGSPVTVWPEVKEGFLRHPELAQRAILARTYFAMLNWSELWSLLGAETGLQLRRSWQHSYYKLQQLRADLTRLRQTVLCVLACLPDGQWLTLEALFDLLRQIWPRFERAEVTMYQYQPQPRTPWFLARAADGQPLSTSDAESWELAQGNFIRRLITGPLSWLGLADLSFEDGRLREFRLHGLADLYQDRLEVPGAPPHAAVRTQTATAKAPAQAVTVEQDTIVVDPASVSAQAHSYLDKIARLEQAAAASFVYRLDPRAVYETFEAGLALTDLFNDWAQMLPIAIPDQIRGQLSSWWQAYGQVRIYEKVTIIEFADDYALAEMRAVTSLNQYLLAEISPRLALIAENGVDILTAELEKAGYTPRQTEQV